ncbi:aminotransferase [Leucothrix pacifica]|nr:aminotransferase [Leucothrix pacifica]
MITNTHVAQCSAAPIAEVKSWVKDPDSPKLIDMCQAVPAHLPAQALLDYLAEVVRNGDGAGYTSWEGIEPLRSALADDINQRYQASITADDAVITAGCNQAFSAVIDALCEEADEVIVALPCYFNHQMWLNIRGIVPRYLTLNTDTAIPDPAEVNDLISERTKAIVLVTPNNPTGATYSPECIEQFYQLAKANNVALIVDETYRDFIDLDKPPHHLFQHQDWSDTFIHLYSFSKVFALTGERVGAIVCSQSLLKQLEKIQDCAVICAPHSGQLAATYGIKHLADWKREKFESIQQRGEALKQAFNHSDLKYKLLSVGAYFAYVKHPFAEDSMTVSRRLVEEFEVLSIPGESFGEDQEQYIRFAFANVDESRFPDLVERLIASQKSL